MLGRQPLVRQVLHREVLRDTLQAVGEYLLRFLAFIVSRQLYRYREQGEEHNPDQGAAQLVCNHVSYIDTVLLVAASPRPTRVVMDHRIFAAPVLGPQAVQGPQQLQALIGAMLEEGAVAPVPS